MIRTGKGLLLVNMGDGKGKTTAAIGVAYRAFGHGMKVAVIQFIKGTRRSGEQNIGEQTKGLTWLTIGNGCTLPHEDTSEDRAKARTARDKAKELLHSEELNLLILDEILYAIDLGFLSVAETVAEFVVRNPNLHLILTGRNAPTEIMEIADLVTEMRSLKHPFQRGMKGLIGVDF
jgi:cob(I)alamin adenosyltransferase